ncbi:malto-oligosyltrehalose trehalohydrolase [Candidatus Tenderia electrophaga]|jgi:1,4-alpha-glucan branching enzyme/maltooligosyltrehalose trehalohydrolase|uniref:Malto-oligosyltrehalose trehalohydrolase n=1 Tax=Candidatus Tenderia electrophaga TaxID=1748243 RepID=A0A0S2TFK3_9GAMM|nr:malto-oligosyltrehalose trehalohydrolase [Candidatus Tenderia electrophaga]
MTASNSGKQRHHSMPFGAQLLDMGGVRFRLWAPAAQRVELCLIEGEAETRLPMTRQDEGWFEWVTEQAGNGSRYRFRIDAGMHVPDPASRYQPEDVHGPSEVVDPRAWAWQDEAWLGRPWQEAVIYELHVGSFSPQGNYAAIQARLDTLVELGVTAVELMPVADFPGRRNWGYDGVYLFAPDSQYGRPEDLKALVEAAHARGLMVFLDVVYNHFGPEGNYLHAYAPQFFTERHHTPWGAAINYDGKHSHWVREFFIHNALYWLAEYHLDGLRLDAVHAIIDDSQPDILTELAERVQRHFGNQRQIHLVLENDRNAAHYLRRSANGRPEHYVAQWNDDIHHALHVLLTGEGEGYYMDYAPHPLPHLQRCLSEGFAYQGEASAYREAQARGEASAHLPATAFVSFLQNHDQVGNRAFGERIAALTDDKRLRAALSLLLLAPAPPLLFMGQEWNSSQPFPFFCDFGADLAEKVVEGRRNEFAHFPEFNAPAARERIPDPMAEATFNQAILDWQARHSPDHQPWLTLHKELLALRHAEVIPRLHNLVGGAAATTTWAGQGLRVDWSLGDGAGLALLANLGDTSIAALDRPSGRLLYSTHPTATQADALALPPWSVCWYLDEARHSR